MSPVEQTLRAFIEQIKQAKQGNLVVLAQIRAGLIPAGRLADASRRLADCEAILAQYAHRA